MRASPAAVTAARGAEHAPAERRAGASHAAGNAAATEVVGNAMQEGAFMMALVNGEEHPAVLTGGVVYVIGPVASPAPEPPASNRSGCSSYCAALSARSW